MVDNSIIVTVLQKAHSRILRTAINYKLDYDDLYQDLAVMSLELLQKPLCRSLDEEKIKGYLYGAIKSELSYNIFDKKKKMYGYTLKSLEEPLYDDDTTTLADSLPCIEPPQHDELREDSRYAAIYAALRRCYLDEQRYIKDVFDLNAYRPDGYFPYYHGKKRTRPAIQQSAYKRLRNDAQFAREVFA